MSQQYPPQSAPQPAPVKKKRGKGCLFGFIGAAVLVVIIVAASTDGSKGTSDSGSSEATGTHKSAPKAEDPVKAFKSYAAEHGSANETAAVKHVTKIQGADGKNDILDSADIYTDYSGDLTSADGPKGKLIASAFADWQKSRGKDSDNGLVTVYNKSGDLLNNGQY